jgi:hypothetical protein
LCSKVLEGLKYAKKGAIKRISKNVLFQATLLYKRDKNIPKVGFGRFCQFRLKNCVFPGAPESHNICVCKIHENFKLMLDCKTIETVSEKWFVTKIRKVGERSLAKSARISKKSQNR